MESPSIRVTFTTPVFMACKPSTINYMTNTAWRYTYLPTHTVDGLRLDYNPYRTDKRYQYLPSHTNSKAAPIGLKAPQRAPYYMLRDFYFQYPEIRFLPGGGHLEQVVR